MARPLTGSLDVPGGNVLFEAVPSNRIDGVEFLSDARPPAVGLEQRPLGPARFVVHAVAMTLAEAVLRGVGLVILLVMLRSVIRNDNAAAILCAMLIAAMTLGDTYGPLWLRAMYAVPVSILGVLLARQAGLLAVSRTVHVRLR